MFRLEVETDNAAFETYPTSELARILRGVATKLEQGALEGAVMDLNGNKVGAYSYDEVEA